MYKIFCSMSVPKKLYPQDMVQRGFKLIGKQDYWSRVTKARFRGRGNLVEDDKTRKEFTSF